MKAFWYGASKITACFIDRSEPCTIVTSVVNIDNFMYHHKLNLAVYKAYLCTILPYCEGYNRLREIGQGHGPRPIPEDNLSSPGWHLSYIVYHLSYTVYHSNMPYNIIRVLLKERERTRGYMCFESAVKVTIHTSTRIKQERRV